jgi:hypothetical protein
MVDFGDWMKDRYTMNTFQPEKNDLRGAKKDLPLRPQDPKVSLFHSKPSSLSSYGL